MPPGEPRSNVEKRRFLLELLPPRSVGAEIGVHVGDFSAAILEVVAPVQLHLIDPWSFEPGPEYEQAWYGGRATEGQAELDGRHDRVHERFAPDVAVGRVVIHRTSSKAALQSFPDASLDWVYIDGNHRYDFVVDDLELSLAKTRPGGLVTGDDYAPGGWWEGGVKRAVDELAASGAAELVLIRDHQYVFRRPG